MNSFGICLNKSLQYNILILCNILKQLDFPTLIIYITLYNYIVQLKTPLTCYIGYAHRSSVARTACCNISVYTMSNWLYMHICEYQVEFCKGNRIWNCIATIMLLIFCLMWFAPMCVVNFPSLHNVQRFSHTVCIQHLF